MTSPQRRRLGGSGPTDLARPANPPGRSDERPQLPLGGRDTLTVAGMAAALLAYWLAPGAPLAVASAAGFGLLGYYRPVFALTAFIAVLPAYYLPRYLVGPVLPLPEATLLAGTAAILARAFLARDLGFRPTRFDAAAALLLAAALLSLLPSEYLTLSLRGLRTLVLEPLLFFYLLVAVFPRVTALRTPVAGFLVSATAVALLAVLQVAVNLETVQTEGVRRALGPYPSPNHLGLYLGRALPFALALAAWGHSWHRGYLVAGGTIALGLTLTFSIGAWLGAATSVLLLAALRGRRPFATMALAGGIAASVVLVVLGRLGVERGVGQATFSGATASFRRSIWASAVAMIQDHAWLGIGLDNFLYRYQLQYILPAALAEPNISHPHNWIAQFWLELGLLGLIAALLLVVGFLLNSLKMWRQDLSRDQRAFVAGGFSSMAGWLVHGSFDNSYFLMDLAVLFWWHLAVLQIAGQSPADPSAARE
jgi:putative inorganic carbon (hco3(-)) transporter